MRNVSLFVDNLTVIDSSVLCPQQGLSGRSWICDLVLEGALDSQSMVMDFGQVKKRIKQVIDAAADHKLLIPRRHAALTDFQAIQGRVALTWHDAQGRVIRLESPQEGVCALDADIISPDSVARFLEPLVLDAVPETVDHVSLKLREERIDTPCYHYSHGLKKHDGNCQRIAHGHRSRLAIWRDGKPAPDLEAQWAAAWDHIYIGSAEDVVARTKREGRDYLHFAYDAPQGRFELELAAERCCLIPADSTVESIAAYIAQLLKSAQPGSSFTVKAYEGVGKGAIASS